MYSYSCYYLNSKQSRTLQRAKSDCRFRWRSEKLVSTRADALENCWSNWTISTWLPTQPAGIDFSKNHRSTSDHRIPSKTRSDLCRPFTKCFKSASCITARSQSTSCGNIFISTNLQKRDQYFCLTVSNSVNGFTSSTILINVFRYRLFYDSYVDWSKFSQFTSVVGFRRNVFSSRFVNIFVHKFRRSVLSFSKFQFLFQLSLPVLAHWFGGFDCFCDLTLSYCWARLSFCRRSCRLIGWSLSPFMSSSFSSRGKIIWKWI